MSSVGLAGLAAFAGGIWRMCRSSGLAVALQGLPIAVSARLLAAVSAGGGEASAARPLRPRLTSFSHHPAGTIAAHGNSAGVVGVAAKGARVHMINMFGPNLNYIGSEDFEAWDTCYSQVRPRAGRCCPCQLRNVEQPYELPDLYTQT